MAMNKEYYTGKIQQITAILQLVSMLKTIIVPVIQFVEDTMPAAKGADKLRAATNFIKEAVSDSEEISTTINSFWGVFTGAISAFALAAKTTGLVKKVE